LGKVDRWTDAYCERELGLLKYSTPQALEAEAHFQKSLFLFEQEKDEQEIGWVLFYQGLMALHVYGNHPAARRCFSSALDNFRATQHERGIAYAAHCLGQVVNHQGDYAAAQQYYTESFKCHHILQNADQIELGWAHIGFGIMLMGQGEFLAAQQHYRYSWQLFKQVTHGNGEDWALIQLVGLLITRQKYAAAQVLLSEIPAPFHRFDEADSKRVWVAYNWGRLALGQQEFSKAKQTFQAMLNMLQQLEPHAGGLIMGLEGLAYALIYLHQSTQAAGLLAAAEKLRQQFQDVMSPTYRAVHEGHLVVLHSLIDPAALPTAWPDGQAVVMEQVVAAIIDPKN
jgi:tetratricopeptide (TPR) repeat protein